MMPHPSFRVGHRGPVLAHGGDAGGCRHPPLRSLICRPVGADALIGPHSFRHLSACTFFCFPVS